MSAILERIQKCIALSASSNIEEARTSAYLACQMIREHKIELKSVEYDDTYIARNAATRPTRPRCGDAYGYVTEDDLSSFFRTTGPAYVFTCRGCGGRVSYTSQSFSAEGGIWHPGCWAKKRQQEARRSSVLCNDCGEEISGRQIPCANGKGLWHQECWSRKHCAKCKVRFKEGDKITTEKSTGENWHRECFNERRCAWCGEELNVGDECRRMCNLDKIWHPKCFRKEHEVAFSEDLGDPNCQICKKAFDAGDLVVPSMEEGRWRHAEEAGCFGE